jgi:uncharacterized protein YtpQ (UPF0354 family)
MAHRPSFFHRVISCFRNKPKAPPPVSAAEFTEAFAHILREKMPGLKVTICGPLELQLVGRDGTEQSSFLENAFTEYQAHPGLQTEVLEKFTSALRETLEDTHDRIDRTRIVPVIKDAAYIEDVRRALESRGHGAAAAQAYDRYNSELVVLYAEDTPKNMRFLTEENVRELGIEREELRALAIQNLRNVLANVELTGENGLYLVSAGGDYEASLLLMDSLWTSGQIKVSGEIVVAIPARGVLVVTGSENKPALKKVRELAVKTAAEAAYRLSPNLFVYRNSRFELFNS